MAWQSGHRPLFSGFWRPSQLSFCYCVKIQLLCETDLSSPITRFLGTPGRSGRKIAELHGPLNTIIFVWEWSDVFTCKGIGREHSLPTKPGDSYRTGKERFDGCTGGAGKPLVPFWGDNISGFIHRCKSNFQKFVGGEGNQCKNSERSKWRQKRGMSLAPLISKGHLLLRPWSRYIFITPASKIWISPIVAV